MTSSPSKPFSHSQSRIGRPSSSAQQPIAQQPLSELIRRVGHEIDNPLTAIISIATMFGKYEKFGTDSASREKLSSYADSIVSEAWRITALVERLVLLTGTTNTLSSSTEIQPIFTRALKKVQSSSRYDQQQQYQTLNLTANFHADACDAWIEPDQLEAILSEVLDNAHFNVVTRRSEESTTPNSSPATAEIQVWVQPISDSKIEIRIDSFNATSCALDLNSLFEPFSTEFSSHKRLGLGLTMVAAVLGRIGGSLEVEESKHTAGYVFSTRLILPSSKSKTTSKSTKIQASEVNSRLFSTLPQELSVLIIEDEEAVSSAITKLLEISIGQETNLGCQCVLPEQALALFEQGARFDAILCDLNLQQMSGQSLFQLIQQRYPHLESSLAFITGDRGGAATKAFFESSGRPHLLKPFEAEQLIELVLQLVRH